MISVGPSVNGSALNEQQAKQIDEQDVIIKTLNTQLAHYKSDLQTQMELTSTLETSLVDSEKNRELFGKVYILMLIIYSYSLQSAKPACTPPRSRENETR
jgi:hypothetical protein